MLVGGFVAAGEADHRAVAIEVHAIHQAAHEKNTESAIAFFQRRAVVARWNEALAVIAYFDREFAVVERAPHRERAWALGRSVLDGVTQCFARCEAYVGDFVARKTANARETRNGVPSGSYVSSIAGKNGAIVWNQRSYIPD